MPDETTPTVEVDERDRLDRALLMRVAENRDTAAMEALYRRLKPRLTRFMRRLTADTALIEEAYNDVMIIVWDKAGQYESRSKVSSWVFTIAYRTCLRMVKKHNRREATVKLIDDATLDSMSAETPQELDGNAELAAAVRALSAKQRVVVELCYFEGYSLEEISRIVNCPLNTVKTRLHHARKKIRELLESARLSMNAASGEGVLQ